MQNRNRPREMHIKCIGIEIGYHIDSFSQEILLFYSWDESFQAKHLAISRALQYLRLWFSSFT